MAAVGMPLIGVPSRTEANHSVGGGKGDLWTFDEDKAFEMALVANWMQPDRVAKCQAAVPAKSKEALQHRYLLLEADVANIAKGAMRLPTYGASVMPSPVPVPKGKKAAGEERRKGVPWTEEEHRLFVAGLAEFGKGDWRSISRNYVLTRTPTQVASHAQKYFIRMNSGKKNDKRRSSIHDITSSSGNGGSHSRPAGSLPRAAQGGRAPLQGAGNPARPPMPKPAAPMGQIPRARPAALLAQPQQQRPVLQGGRPLLQGGQQRPYAAPRAPGIPPMPRPQTSAQSTVKSPALERSHAGVSVPAVVALPPSAGSLPDRASQPVNT